MKSQLSGTYSLSALSLLFCLIFPALNTCADDPPDIKKPIAVDGVLDLREWDFSRDGSVRLDGRWEFYPGRLLGPSDFAQAQDRKDRGFMPVPGLWKDHTVNGVRLPGRGHATYRLKILGRPDREEKTLIIHRIFTDYKLWINGVPARQRGITDAPIKDGENYIFIHNRRFSTFTPDREVNEIVLQVSNRDYASGGIDRPLRVEDGEVTNRSRSHRMAVNMIMVGLLLFASIYNILFYCFRPEEKAPLYLGFFCIVWTINTFNRQFPILSGSLSYPGNPYLMNYLTVIALIPLCLMMMRSLFPDECSLRIVRFSQVLAAVFIVTLFFVGFTTAEQLMKVYFIWCMFFLAYSIYVFIRTVVNRRNDAVFFLAGFLPISVGGINDILYAMWIVDTVNIAHYSIVLLCISATMVISRRFSRALRKVEELSWDLTEKNLSLQKMDRIKDQFLASTSHELRTPLHGMIGLSESMMEDDADVLSPKALENISLIASSGHRLANMVNDLLDMAKMQDEGLSLNLRPVDLYALSEMVVKLSLTLTGGKPLEIINGIDPDIPMVRADEDRIRQVLHNLVGNAVKFTNKGTIELSARMISREDGDYNGGTGTAIEVSVADTGTGIPDEYKKEIFKAYRQVDGGDTRSYPGTGLGLAIAKQIIELHGGAIHAASGKNGGSVFLFTLPVSDEPAGDEEGAIIVEGLNDIVPADGTPGPAGTGEGAFENNPVFLIVDDDPVNIRVLRNYLEPKKCIVKTASDGISALDIIDRDDSIDLVLLDIMMPVMSGYEVCRRIRLTRGPGDLPVIMLTAKNMMSDIDAAFAAGANDYIVKPFRIHELLARAGTMLKLRNIRKSVARGITIRDRHRVYSLTFSEIVYITSHLKNVVIHTIGDDVEVPVMMKDIIHRLPPDIFVRIHKSHIINIRYIHSLSHVLSGRYRVRLRDEDDTELPVGPAFLEALRKRI